MREVRGGRSRPLEKELCGKDACGKKILNMAFEPMRMEFDGTIAMQHPREQQQTQCSSLSSALAVLQKLNSDAKKTESARISIILAAFILRIFYHISLTYAIFF